MFALILVILSQISDFATTMYGFQHGFSEGNSLLIGLVGTPEFAVIKYLVCLMAILTWLLFRRTRWSIFIQAGFYLSAVVTFGIAFHNLSLVT
jgi:hypothetical protein